MGSRALSHDSIFMEENVLTEPEPSKVLSQENVNSKIKALQVEPHVLDLSNTLRLFILKPVFEQL